MATTTTNYGFDVPTSSDLVKNGATAISTLGQDIDTFLFRPFTRNVIINGGFDIWQRGTSFTANTVYTADRWYIDRTNTLTIAQDTAIAPTGFRYAAKLTAGATVDLYYQQAIETLNANYLAGQNVTLSAYLGTSNSQNVTLRLDYSTSVDVGVAGSWTQITPTSGGTSATTSTLARASAVFAVPSTAKSLRVMIVALGLTNTNWLGVTGVQLEIGSQASPFSRATGTIQGELAACQRYFYKKSADSSNAYAYFGQGTITSTTNLRALLEFPVAMRTSPTVTKTGNMNISTAGVAVTSVTIDGNTANGDGLGTKVAQSLIFAAASGLTVGQSGYVFANNDTTANLSFSAEL